MRACAVSLLFMHHPVLHLLFTHFCFVYPHIYMCCCINPELEYNYSHMSFSLLAYLHVLLRKCMNVSQLFLYSADNGGVDAGNNFPLRGQKATRQIRPPHNASYNLSTSFALVPILTLKTTLIPTCILFLTTDLTSRVLVYICPIYLVKIHSISCPVALEFVLRTTTDWSAGLYGSQSKCRF